MPPFVRMRARSPAWCVTGPGGATVTADYPRGIAGAAVERSQLDLLLLNAAIAAGADFTPGVNVVAPTIASDDARVNGVRIQHGCRKWRNKDAARHRRRRTPFEACDRAGIDAICTASETLGVRRLFCGRRRV